MDIIYEIRRRHLVQKQTISAIAREMGISRPTVRRHLKTVEEPRYARVQPVWLCRVVDPKTEFSRKGTGVPQTGRTCAASA